MYRKRIYQKLYSLFEPNNEGKIIKFLKFLGNFNNQNNTDNMEPIYVVKPGHYVEKSTMDSDTKTIIRIIGPSKDREGYWLTEDKKEISEYLLQNDYVAMDTSPTDGNKNKKKGKDIFGDFKKVDVDVQQQEQPVVEHIIVETNINQPIQEQPEIKKQPDSSNISNNKRNIELGFDINVIEKLNIDNINRKKKEKLGIEHGISKPVITIELPIEFNYDLEKLRQTIELLDLNETEIVNYIVSKIDMSQIQMALFTEVQNIIDGDTTNLGVDALSLTQEKLRSVTKPLIDNANEEIVENVIKNDNTDNKPEFAVQRRNEESIQNIDVEKSIIPEKVQDIKLEAEIDSIQQYIDNNFK